MSVADPARGVDIFVRSIAARRTIDEELALTCHPIAGRARGTPRRQRPGWLARPKKSPAADAYCYRRLALLIPA